MKVLSVDEKLKRSLEDSELRYRRLFEASQDGILILDAETGMIEDVNPYLVKLLGYSHAELIKRKLWQVGAFKDFEASKGSFKALQANEYIRFENLPLKTKDGELIQVVFISNLYLVDDKKVIQCSIRDITEQKRMIAALEHNEKTYHQMINQSPDGFFVIETEGRILSVNEAICNTLGFSRKDLLSMNIWDIIPDQFLDQHKKRIARVLSGKSVNEGAEYKIQGKDGQIYFVEILSAPHYSGKKIIGFQGIAHDISDRKRTERALHESESRFREMQETVDLIAVMLDIDGRVTFCNQYLLNLTGYSLTDVLGENWFELFVSPENEVEDYFLAAMQSGAVLPSHWENEILTSSGERRLVSWNNTILRDLEGNVIGSNSLGKDITESKQREMEIHNRLKDLELLYQSGLEFNHLLSPEAIAKRIIDLLEQKMDWHHTAIRLYNPETKRFELLAYKQPDQIRGIERERGAEKLELLKTKGQGLCGWVQEHGQVVRTDNLKEDPRYYETFPGLKSGLYIPIKNVDRVIGVISIESEKTHAFSESDERLTSTLARQAAVAIERAALFKDLRRSNAELNHAYDSTLLGWAKTLELRDEETKGHADRVTNNAVRLAEAIGIDEEELTYIKWGSLLHDIGKMGVPDSIFAKPGKLSEEEWVLMRQHPTYAYNTLSGIDFLKESLEIPYAHHEKWDGTGYPRGLTGREIPLSARIFAVVDVWDALTSDRPYRKAWSEKKAIAHIQEQAGKHFDPEVVKAFLKIHSTGFFDYGKE